ncbi:MAG: histidine kinase, partial [Candidatus Delongbacteria bacterium]|nr:histidine kinase [Candidatus Delongbacteria bacterium]
MNIAETRKKIILEYDFAGKIFAEEEEEEEEVMVVSLKDITEQKLAEEELVQHRDRLEELVKERTSQLQFANKELESFSYSVSHDLKAPVRHILGFSDIFEQEFLSMIPQKGHDLLNKIKYSANKMERLIDDLLNFS